MRQFCDEPFQLLYDIYWTMWLVVHGGHFGKLLFTMFTGVAAVAGLIRYMTCGADVVHAYILDILWCIWNISKDFSFCFLIILECAECVQVYTLIFTTKVSLSRMVNTGSHWPCCTGPPPHCRSYSMPQVEHGQHFMAPNNCTVTRITIKIYWHYMYCNNTSGYWNKLMPKLLYPLAKNLLWYNWVTTDITNLPHYLSSIEPWSVPYWHSEWLDYWSHPW